jgi:hypothetical protein
MLEIGQFIYMLMTHYGNLYTCNCKHHRTETESKALFRYKVPLAVSDSGICQAGLHEVLLAS